MQKTRPEGIEFFEKRVRPVLVDNCYTCHSADSKKVRGDFRLDTLAGLLRGGRSQQAAVVPGKPGTSELIQAIRYSEDVRMPPKGKLPEQAIEDLTRWVEMGAPYPGDAANVTTSAPGSQSAGAKTAGGGTGGTLGKPDGDQARSHWAYQPIKKAPTPQVRDKTWPRGTIDAFVLARLESKGLAPAAPAGRREWLRRATYDLTGLPPTSQETAAFLADSSPDASARVIDRLLASPRYGEQWGRHWLDLARYADTGGESADFPIPQAYLYRDYVIDAFNADKPYDQFIREQIAGDLLPSSSESQRRQQIIATGFVALSRRFSVQPEGQIHLTIEDTIDTLGKSVLGLTVGCARCHDHKFDPIPTEDYYGLYGIFSSTRYPFPGSENRPRPHNRVLLLTADEEKQTFAKVATELDTVEAGIDAINGNLARREEQNKLIHARDKIYKELGFVPYAYALAEGPPADAPVQIRGEPGRAGKPVPRHFLTVLGGQALPRGNKGSGRLELAAWLTDPKNPLTARVMLNRIWQQHFGKGLVATPSDFGTRGQPPTHPELLDFLARKFIDSEWSIKAIHREIMLSAAYGMSSAWNDAYAEADPNNDLLWHFSRRRLTAEEIRDTMLAISGELDLSPAGPQPFPPEDKWNYTQHAAFSAVYDTNHRSVYVMQQRIRKHPFFAVFDGADTNASTPERLGGTTPLQALYFMNDPFTFARADGLVKRIESSARRDLERIHLAYELVLGRTPAPDELAESVDFLRRYGEQLTASTTQPADQTPRLGLKSLVRVLMSSNEFIFVN